MLCSLQPFLFLPFKLWLTAGLLCLSLLPVKLLKLVLGGTFVSTAPPLTLPLVRGVRTC